MTTADDTHAWPLADAAATECAGRTLAPLLRGGMVIALHGDLGAGKTTLARGVLRGLGWEGPVKSPTYTLVEHYQFSSLYLYHFDFYRFVDPNEWDAAGFSDYFRPDAIGLVEWPERVASILGPAELDVTLAHAGSGRELHIAAHADSGRRLRAAWRAALR